MSALTTHVLDTSTGRPGAGMAIELYRNGPESTLLLSTATNRDGRCDQPLLQGEAWRNGEYELRFRVGDYFRRQGLEVSDPPFLDQVVIRFGVADASQHYHVPLLVSPYGYTTYRGS